MITGQKQRKDKTNHWYVPGKTETERQHIHEHETLQIMQRYALNLDHSKFYHLMLSFSRDQDKRNEVSRICGYKDSRDVEEKSNTYK